MFTAPLITTDALAASPESSSDAPAILDVRWQLATGADRQGYLDGHVPGAVFVDLDRELSDPPSERGRHPLPSAARFSTDMQAAGVCSDRPVVVYDARDSTAAARAWWLLRYFGHPAVAVLDGGLAAWVAAGHPLEDGAVLPGSGDFIARPGGMPTLTAVEAGELASSGVLLDARAPERFAGLVEPIDPVAGHIPGARNRATAENVGEDGRFLEAGALKAGFERLGVREGVRVGAYCGSGVTAAHELLALALTGIDGALYPGSWSEWIVDPSRPVERSLPAERE